MSVFDHIRHLASTRWLRVLAVAVLVMCTITWVAQTVSSVQHGDLAVMLAMAEHADHAQDSSDPSKSDCGDRTDCEGISFVAFDETHDVKLFFLREFTHWFQPAVGRIPRNRDLSAILRMSSETFRPPDQQICSSGRFPAF